MDAASIRVLESEGDMSEHLCVPYEGWNSQVHGFSITKDDTT